jgi:hypothetical protein
MEGEYSSESEVVGNYEAWKYWCYVLLLLSYSITHNMFKEAYFLYFENEIND